MYYSLNRKLKEQFGCKVYKLALESGCTCPNRDGTLGTRGCIFCLDGSGEFAQKPCEDIAVQISLAKERVARKIKNGEGKYIAYFQSYTNTYGNAQRLERLYEQALFQPDIVALSIATRPDCLGEDVLGMLARLREKKPLWVELGLQTVHTDSIRYIRRGYENEVYERAVRSLHAIGCEVVTHVILGLPGESREQMVKTVEYAVKCGTDGIKLQLLHVLEGTDLASDYLAGGFTVMSLEEYVDTVCECVKVIPQNVVIHRLTGDGAKKHLIAPMWSGDKKRVLNALNKAMENLK